MATDVNGNSIDVTAGAFNDFNKPTFSVNSNEYSVVNSFLKSISSSTLDADKLTSVFFQISKATNIPVLELIDEVKGQNEIQLTATLAAYLNSTGESTALLGIYSAVIPNFYVARNILP